ncbi:MAG: DUF5706 domain-containing protein [Candidatus Marinimicrobia bacterium]|nr:DUF5706 domain-containing protein [Candidatus Neomarinimicrobiota bacterium]
MQESSDTPEKVMLKEADGQDIIHTLRTAQQHQVTLSLVADQKANIIIGFALIFFSVIQSQMFSNEFSNKIYFWPLSALSLTVFTSFFMAILVVLPRFKSSGLEKPKDMPNPLFFGFFASFSEREYTDYMIKTLDGNAAAREMLIKDLYQIGVVLKKKYQLLRVSYMLLAVGALLSVVVLAIKLLFL